MAVYIKPIPVLTGKVAKKFEKAARESEAKKGTVDFSKEVKMTRSLLAKYYECKFKHFLPINGQMKFMLYLFVI